jgi:hypothetical protein
MVHVDMYLAATQIFRMTKRTGKQRDVDTL